MTFSTFEELGFEPEQKERPVKAFSREAVKGLTGTYGDILQSLGLQQKENLLPGQKARLEREFKASEYELPFLTEDTILPEYSRLPTSEDVEKGLTALGIKKQETTIPEKFAGRLGRLIGGGASLGAPTVGASTLAATAGQLAEQLDVGEKGQALAEIAGLLGPSAIKGITSLFKLPTEKTAAGLTKIRAPESKFLKKAIITPKREAQLIETLNKEAAGLTEKAIEKKLPIYKKIQEGFDFEQKFQKDFGKVQEIAKKANPSINIKPISSLIRDTIDKYSGIPRLHEDARKVVKELKAFGRNPRNDLADLLKIYRSNGQKIKNIYEKSRLMGTRKEYVDFLTDYNRAIADSIKSTLPKNSKFVNLFEETNKEYKNYKDALNVKSLLKPVLGENPTLSQLTKISSDPKLQKKLALSVGKDASKDIIEISRDLESALAAIKKIPKKEFLDWTSAVPISIFLPFSKTIAAGLSAVKGLHASKFAYGLFLTSAKRRNLYKEVLNSIKSGDKKAYIQAASQLIKAAKEPSESFESLGFEPFDELGFIED